MAATPRRATESHFRVVVRARPMLPHEHEVGADGTEISGNAITLRSHDSVTNAQVFQFDRVFDASSAQDEVYQGAAQPAVASVVEGFNASIIAYGQTGTGKTYTMEGTAEAPGIIPRAIGDIFAHVERGQLEAPTRKRFLLRTAFLQIYNDNVSDLLRPERTGLLIREDRKRGLYVENLSEWVVRRPSEVQQLLRRGSAVRATGATRANEASSRSHSVFIIVLEQSEAVGSAVGADEQRFRVGKLNLVDLAGSESARAIGGKGQRLEECKRINASLSALGNVIAALTDTRGRAKPSHHIPYRDSKLTRLLEDSLGGNCKTTMVANISTALWAGGETQSTLKFAQRAQHVQNYARVNEDNEAKTRLRQYELELAALRAQLREREQGVVDKRELLALEEERKRAVADRLQAIHELEARSQEVLHEKAAKRDLEHYAHA